MSIEATEMSQAGAIAHKLAREIVTGGFSPGSKLPTETDLATTFAVSRPTVRAALKIIAGRGLTSSRRGSGHVVTEWWTQASPAVLVDAIQTIDLQSTAARTLITDVLEARTEIFVTVVQLAARRKHHEDMGEAGRLLAEIRNTSDILPAENAILQIYGRMQANIVLRMQVAGIAKLIQAVYQRLQAMPADGQSHLDSLVKIHNCIDMAMEQEAAARTRAHFSRWDTALRRQFIG